MLAAVCIPVSGAAVQDQHALQPRTRQAEHATAWGSSLFDFKVYS